MSDSDKFVQVTDSLVARIEAPMREARSSPHAHRGARVIGTDALPLVLILREPSDSKERKQISAEPMSAEEWKRQYVREGLMSRP
jgi:hypothetical protein